MLVVVFGIALGVRGTAVLVWRGMIHGLAGRRAVLCDGAIANRHRSERAQRHKRDDDEQYCGFELTAHEDIVARENQRFLPGRRAAAKFPPSSPVQPVRQCSVADHAVRFSDEV